MGCAQHRWCCMTMQGNIAGWKKGEGDEIAAGDVLAEVETDKATMDWEAQVRMLLGSTMVVGSIHAS